MFLLVRWSADIPSYGQLSWLARPDWINGIFHQPHESRKREASLVLMLSNATLNIGPASAFHFAQACFIHCVVQRPHSPFFWCISADVETALAIGNVFAVFIVSYLVIPILHSHRKQAFSCSGPLQPTYLWAVTVFFLHNLRNRGYLPDNVLVKAVVCSWRWLFLLLLWTEKTMPENKEVCTETCLCSGNLEEAWDLSTLVEWIPTSACWSLPKQCDLGWSCCRFHWENVTASVLWLQGLILQKAFILVLLLLLSDWQHGSTQSRGFEEIFFLLKLDWG